MTVEVTVRTVQPTPTAVIVAAATWAEFPKMWGPMLDKVWSFLRGDAPKGSTSGGITSCSTRTTSPTSKSAFR
jgi:hypothetical protein